MDKVIIENLLKEVDGCTFATLDAETQVSPGITKRVTGKRIILFTNKKSSGYENMVKRRLAEAGKDPDSFSSGDLPWGTQIADSPLIVHKGKVYLKCIELTPGIVKYFMLGQYIDDISGLNLRERGSPNQGLAPSAQVKVSCYDLENITRIALMGEELVSEAPKRAILRINS